MSARDEQCRSSPSSPRGDLESPFLQGEVFAQEVEDEWEPRLAGLPAASPFQHAFEQSRTSLIMPEELEEKFVGEEAGANADDYVFNQDDLSERGTSTNYESLDSAATLEFEAAGCPGEHELLDSEGELLDSEIWHGTADQIAFRDRVLNAHLARSQRRAGAAKRDLSPNELDDVTGTEIKMGLNAAAAAGRLLTAANADLAKAQAAGHADALRTIRLGATSGYRDRAYQNKLWRSYFTAKGGYYDRTQTARERLADGPHSEQAVTYMLTPKKEGGFGLGGRIAAPGYSNHQGGIAIDFSQKRQKGHEIENNSSEKARVKWRSTWFHNWLENNAARIFGFQPIPTEEWHWEYRRGSGTTASAPAATSLGSASAAPSTYLGGKLWTFEAKVLPTRVAVFCPQAALSLREVEVLVYAHGLLNGCKRPKSIPDGIITDTPFKLGDIVTASGRPVVLGVPYLDWANPGGESAFGSAHRKWHALGKPAHLNSLIAEVLAELGRVQSIGTPSLRNLVIAGHSRAYDFLEPLAHFHSDSEMQQGALARLSQVWAFDTTYTGDVSKWTSWLAANPGLQVTVIYRPGTKTGTVGYAFYKRRSARLAVIQARESHCAVPGTRLRALLTPLSATDQETEAPWDENELKSDETNREAEDYAPDAFNDEPPSGQDATEAEFVSESDEPIEPTEAEQSLHGDEASAVDEASEDEVEQWTPGGNLLAEDEVKAAVSIASIQFAFSGNTNVHAIYLAANSHPLLPGMTLDWWGHGAKITDPEWIRGRSDASNKGAVVTRNKPVRMRVKLECSTSVALKGILTATPTLDGSAKFLQQASIPFTYPSGAASQTVDLELASTMPDEVGRFQLKVKWEAHGEGISFAKETTTHNLYAAYGRPLEPDYDSASTADTGVFTSVTDGTLTGTGKRLDKLTQLLGSTRRLPAKTANDLIELLWKLHVGINDTPNAPPYFDAGHSRFLTTDGERDGPEVPINDQWLAWLLTKSPHWNDASCIGHVQLLKTMAAAIGIFVRRTWVYPTTKTMPDKSTPAIADTDCYSLGTLDSSKMQKWSFTHGGKSYEANPKLMEPGLRYENFEACMLTSQGRFLTGGYATSSNPKSFTTDRGFKSAKELLRWWCNTKRPNFGKRFMVWVYNNRSIGEAHFWDVDGKHYDIADYVKIRNAGKELPPP